MDADALLEGEEFIYVDCMALDRSTLVAYKIVEGRLQIYRGVFVDETDLTSVFQNFLVDIDGVTYLGGEISAHSSGGFFCKKFNGHVAWVVMSLEAGPFVGLERCDDELGFLTETGCRWIVKGDDLENITIRSG